MAAAVSNGSLVYVARSQFESQLTWFDRSGKALGVAGPRSGHASAILSPDGSAAMVRRLESNLPATVWLYDLVRGSHNRVESPNAQASTPAWFADGRRVLLGMVSGPAGRGLYRKDVHGGGQAELVVSTPKEASMVPSDVSRDGRFLLYTSTDPKTDADIWYLPLDGTPDWSRAVRFLGTEAVESQAQISPDGQWIAYASDGPGALEVFIRRFPSGAGV